MSTQQKLNTISLEAGADLSADQFKFMTLSSGQAILNTVAGGSCIGVLQGDPDAQGKAAEIATGTGQIVKVEAGAAVTQGDKVQSDGTGRAILAASADHVQGTALDAAAAAGELIRVLLLSEHILA